MVHHVHRIKITELKPHPRQDSLFPDSGEADIDLLCADMHQRGLQHPVEVLRDHTILCGHRRVQAAKKLAWEEIDVIVRDDLAGASDAEIEQHIILDNYARRHLKPMEQVRCAHRLLELLKGGDVGNFTPEELGDVYCHTRDRIGQILKISGRQVSRLMAIMDAPLAVQQAFDDRKLSAEAAAKIANLPIEDQDAITELIEQGRDPKKVARQYLRRGRPLNKEEKAFEQLVAAIDILTAARETNFDSLRIVGSATRDHAALLRQSGPLLEVLAGHVERRREEVAAALEEKMDEVCGLLDCVAATDPS